MVKTDIRNHPPISFLRAATHVCFRCLTTLLSDRFTERRRVGEEEFHKRHPAFPIAFFGVSSAVGFGGLRTITIDVPQRRVVRLFLG